MSTLRAAILRRRRRRNALLSQGGAPLTFDQQILALNPLAFWYAGDGASTPAQMNGATDGGAVTTWDDLSTNGYDVTQAGADTLKPTYDQSDAAFNNRGSLAFDGGDYLSRNLAGPIAANLSTFTIAIVFATTSVNDFIVMYGEGKSDNAGRYLWLATDSTNGAMRFQASNGTATILNGGTGVLDGNAHLLVIRKLGTSSHSLRIDGVEVDSDTATDSATALIDRLAIGALIRTSVASQFIGDIAFVAVLPSADHTQLEAAVIPHYGI